MQVITKNDTNAAIFGYPDDVSITVTENDITVGDPAILIVADCNSSNATVHTVDALPDDFSPSLYLYDGTSFTLNPDWLSLEDLIAQEEAVRQARLPSSDLAD